MQKDDRRFFMARKHKTTTNNTIGTRSTVNLCAFWAMAIAALMYLFSGLVHFLITVFESIKASKSAAVLAKLVTIGNFLGNIALIVAIAIPAWHYAKGRGKNWRICYWIALVVFALGVVLGMLGGLL